jgi:glycosyltransferase involved in cell wall biosynthesis
MNQQYPQKTPEKYNSFQSGIPIQIGINETQREGKEEGGKEEGGNEEEGKEEGGKVEGGKEGGGKGEPQVPPRISILMPIYNGIEYISESVESVICQTFKEWELIIAVNGHPENSPVYQIAKEYETIDIRIRVLDFYNVKGKANALNDMIVHCKYEYIALLDVDDIWMPTKLQVQVNLLKEDKYDVVGTKCVYFEKLEGIIPPIPDGDLSYFNFKQLNPVINSSAILRKELGHWNKEYAGGVEDYELWMRLWLEGKKFYNFEDVLVKHRIHDSSAFNTQDHSEKINQILLM